MDTIVDTKIAEETAEILLSVNAVSINTEKPFRYVSGLLAPLYTDNRLLISHPGEWSSVIGYFEDTIQRHIGRNSVEVLSGTATAAIPHAAGLSLRMGIPMVYVRSSKKEHGKENLIEGEFRPNAKVLIIEDLVSTGKSIGQNVEAVRAAGGIVESCVAITTSTLHAYGQTVSELGIRLRTLTDISAVVAVARKTERISDDQFRSVTDFLSDPAGWGKRNGFD